MTDFVFILTSQNWVDEALSKFADRTVLVHALSLGRSTMVLRSEVAVVNLHQLVGEPGAALFIFAHGLSSQHAEMDFARQCGDPVVTNSGLLADRLVVGTCHSLNGAGLTSVPPTVIGYDGSLVLPRSVTHLRELEPVLCCPYLELLGGASSRQAVDRTKERFRALADDWFARSDIRSRIYAAEMEANADRVGFRGDGGRVA